MHVQPHVFPRMLNEAELYAISDCLGLDIFMFLGVLYFLLTSEVLVILVTSRGASPAMQAVLPHSAVANGSRPQSEPGPKVSSPAWLSHAAGGLHTHRWQEGGLRKTMNAASLNQSLNGVRGCHG